MSKNKDNKENREHEEEVLNGEDKKTIDSENGADTPGNGGDEGVREEPSVEDRLAGSEARVAQLIDQNLRQMADFDNYRKRTMKEKAELIRNASADVISKILPVIDDLERAIANNEKSDDIESIKEGTKLIYNKLMHILESEGLSRIPAVGEQFDTDVHEAVAIVPATEDKTKNTVIDCTREGYRLNDRILRTSQVVVAN